MCIRAGECLRGRFEGCSRDNWGRHAGLVASLERRANP